MHNNDAHFAIFTAVVHGFIHNISLNLALDVVCPMVDLKKLFLLVIFLFAFADADAQELFSSKRKKTFLVQSDTLQLDSLSIVAESLVLTDSLGGLIPSEYYKVLAISGQLVFLPELLKDSLLRLKTIVASYSVFPFLFGKAKYHKNSSWLKPDETGKVNPFLYTEVENKNNDFFAGEGLSKNGSISRGIAFGNNQDVVLNSNLNLQLSGKITDKISILAAIADDNIPIQPEGNTQQLQEFDRVYIQFNDDKSKLIAGDFQLMRPNSYFMNYFKKSQGASFTSSFGLGATPEKQKNNTLSVALSAAVSKGKFSRNVIVGTEGNQGPYRLRGAENESYIVILSGSEKIYIDGQLLERGQENDYVIDYNTAEVSFTPKRIITKDKRITAEFQYSDRNYARSLYDVGADYKNNKLNLRTHFFSEQDNKKKPLLQELKTSDKLVLDSIGDNLEDAVVAGIDTSGYLPNTILYKAVDTLGYSNVFVFSNDSSNAIYRLSFSNVGSGKGNYNPAATSANGKVYQWVAPVNGQSQGSYEPVVLLITPKQKQMLVVAADYAIARNFSSSIELAYTNYDLNTFSSKNKTDDEGYALRFLLMKRTPLSAKENDTLHLITGANLEVVSKYFSPIERFRSIEFDRDWNRATVSGTNLQNIVGAKLGLEKKSIGTALYQFNSFVEQSVYRGYQHNLTSDFAKKGFQLVVRSSLLTSKTELNNGRFLKYKAVLSKEISWVKIGAGIEQEENKTSLQNTDSLLAISFRFLEWQAFVQSADTAKNSFRINYLNRSDWLPSAQGQLKKASVGQSVAANLRLSKNANSDLQISGTYRNLAVLDSLLLSQQPDNSLVARVEYTARILKGAITTSTFYEVGSGLEVKKEYSYIKVQPGQGLYEWKDADGDSIEDLDEFIIAVFADKKQYIKVFTPTSEFVKTYNNQFSEILQLSPANVWSGKKGFRKFIALLSNQTAYRIDRKTSNADVEKFLNPFLNQSKDVEIVTLNSSFRNTFFVNRFNSHFGFDYSYQQTKNKSLLVSGSEERSNVFHTFKIRWNITRKWLLSNDASVGVKSSFSEFFNSRNYTINYLSTEPKLSFQPSTNFRATVNYEYSEKTSKTISLNEDSLQAIGQKLGAEIKYTKAEQGSLIAKFNFILFSYQGDANSQLAYEMLEGLQPGKNYTWNVSYQRNLANNIQLNLSYDGRKSNAANGRIVHIGNVMVRAFF